MRRALWVGATACYLAGLLALTLGPFSWWLNRLTVRMYTMWRYRIDQDSGFVPEDFGVLLNVVLFVPVGLLIGLACSGVGRGRWAAPLGGALLLSLAVEAVQLLPWLDREPSLADVVANALGGLVGAAAVVLIRRRGATGSPRPGRRDRPAA